MLRGRVHDPTARRMGGVAGHAGLFSTAGDLARFSLMLLGGGAHDGIRVLAPALRCADDPGFDPPATWRTAAVSGGTSTRDFRRTEATCFRSGPLDTLVSPAPRCGLIRGRTPSSCFSPADCIPPAKVTSRRSAARSRPSWRHRSWTTQGTQKGDEDTRAEGASASSPVWTGIDVLREEGFSRLSGARVGLVTNQTGRGARRRQHRRPVAPGVARRACGALQP